MKCYEKSTMYLHRKPSEIIHITLQLLLALVRCRSATRQCCRFVPGVKLLRGPCVGWGPYQRGCVVYDKHQGTLIEFTNLGDVNKGLVKFEASIQNEEPQEQLAKSMFVIKVRGLFNKLNYPYAQFACCNITADLLMTPVWEAIWSLETQGFKSAIFNVWRSII